MIAGQLFLNSVESTSDDVVKARDDDNEGVAWTSVASRSKKNSESDSFDSGSSSKGDIGPDGSSPKSSMPKADSQISESEAFDSGNLSELLFTFKIRSNPDAADVNPCFGF